MNKRYKYLLKFLLLMLIAFTGAGWLVFKFIFLLMKWPSQGISIWTQLLLGVMTGFIVFVMISPLILKFLESRQRPLAYRRPGFPSRTKHSTR